MSFRSVLMLIAFGAFTLGLPCLVNAGSADSAGEPLPDAAGAPSPDAAGALLPGV